MSTKIIRDHLVGSGVPPRDAGLVAREVVACIESNLRLRGHFLLPGVGRLEVVSNAWMDCAAPGHAAVAATNPLRLRITPSRRLKGRLKMLYGQGAANE